MAGFPCNKISIANEKPIFQMVKIEKIPAGFYAQVFGVYGLPLPFWAVLPRGLPPHRAGCSPPAADAVGRLVRSHRPARLPEASAAPAGQAGPRSNPPVGSLRRSAPPLRAFPAAGHVDGLPSFWGPVRRAHIKPPPQTVLPVWGGGYRFILFSGRADQYMPPMSPPAGAAGAGGSGRSATRLSVVSTISATEVAFSRAERVTLVGSTMPASIISST